MNLKLPPQASKPSGSDKISSKNVLKEKPNISTKRQNSISQFLSGIANAFRSVFSSFTRFSSSAKVSPSEAPDTNSRLSNYERLNVVDEVSSQKDISAQFSSFPQSFKQIVAGIDSPKNLSAEDLTAIAKQMESHFETSGFSQKISDLNSKGLNSENIACAWMMKLGNNESLSDEKFLNYLIKGQDVFTHPDSATIDFTNSEFTEHNATNTLPAMSWFMIASSGKGLMEKGSTRITLSNEKSYQLFHKLESMMIRRNSTHFGGTSLVSDQGFGKDIPHEKLRGDMPFQFGHMLMYPTSKNSAEDTFATKLFSSSEPMNAESIQSLYSECFSKDIDQPTLADLTNKSFTSKLDVFKVCHQHNPESFNIDIGIKFEDFGFNDKLSHTLIHSKLPGAKSIMNAINKHWYYVGSKKTALKEAFKSEIKNDSKLTDSDLEKMQKHSIDEKKEHMSTLGKKVMAAALELANDIPGYGQGWKVRIQFKTDSFMHEKTITKEGSGTSAIKYLLDDAKKFIDTSEFKSKPQDEQAKIFNNINTLNRSLTEKGTIEGSENMLNLSSEDGS